jgi:hypothetical protein
MQAVSTVWTILKYTYLGCGRKIVYLPPFEQSFDWIDGERRTKSRFSILHFVSSKHDTVMEALEEYSSGGQDQKHEPLTYGEFWNRKNVGIFQEN